MNKETKKCKKCAEEVKIEAVKCKHCGANIPIFKKMSPAMSKFIGWLYGISLLLSSPLAIATGYVLAGIILIFIGLIVLPPSGKLIKISRKKKGWLIAVGVILLLFLLSLPNFELNNNYTIIKKEDTSYRGCSRLSYKIKVSDNTYADDMKNILKTIHRDKAWLSNKIFIYAYTESQDHSQDIYKGRLFMDPNCNKSNEYKIDMNY